MKFTILTASRNCSLFIKQCVQSVIDQTYINWEMLIIDDCSTDNTLDELNNAINGNPNIKLIKSDDRLFCGGSYNKIVQMATGDICGVLDGDDALQPEAIKTVVSYYSKYPTVDFIWTAHRWFNKDMSKFRKGISSPPKRKTIYDTEEGLRHCYSHWRTFRTHMRDRAMLFDVSLKCTVDKNLGYVLEENGRGAFLNKELYNYRYHPTNMSHNSNQKQVWRMLRDKHKNKKRFSSIIL